MSQFFIVFFFLGRKFWISLTFAVRHIWTVWQRRKKQKYFLIHAVKRQINLHRICKKNNKKRKKLFFQIDIQMFVCVWESVCVCVCSGTETTEISNKHAKQWIQLSSVVVSCSSSSSYIYYFNFFFFFLVPSCSHSFSSSTFWL